MIEYSSTHSLVYSNIYFIIILYPNYTVLTMMFDSIRYNIPCIQYPLYLGVSIHACIYFRFSRRPKYLICTHTILHFRTLYRYFIGLIWNNNLIPTAFSSISCFRSQRGLHYGFVHSVFYSLARLSAKHLYFLGAIYTHDYMRGF